MPHDAVTNPDRPPRTTPGTVRVELTPAQARMVNSALAFLEAEDHGDGTHDGYSWEVMERTRAKIHRAMERSGVQP